MERVAMLRGGSRDGETTSVDDDVSRLLAASEAPGLLDVYERTAEPARAAGNEEVAVVFAFVGNEAADQVAPEAIHMPTER